MKRKAGNYLQLSRRIFQGESYEGLSVNAKWLYVVLCELEHRFTGEKDDFFFRSNNDLVKDTGLSLATLKRAKKELLQTDLIQTWQKHFIIDGNKKSEKKVTVYRLSD